MKVLIVIIIVIIGVLGFGYVFLPKQAPLADIPQSERCSVMCQRRDVGALEDLEGKSKAEIRSILGDPQNIDIESDIWVWLFQWDDYKAEGLARDWKTMAANSSGDGLWIKFESDFCVYNFPYSFSASDPLDLP